jgi:cytochrome c-type biogenesis protein CcmF
MPALGTFLLLASFVGCAYAIAACVAGARRRSRRLTESGIGAFYLVTALMTVASGVMIHAFLTNNFAIKYVHRTSDAALSLPYKIAAYWGQLDGSIMFWVFILSSFGAIAVYTNRERHRELIPWVVSVIAATELFFLLVMALHNNPFATFLTAPPAEGQGLNPLLQNFYMAIHPPALYVGLVTMTIPFAFGIAALITGHLDDAWLRAVRRWTMVGWLALSFGLTLGMLWAYEELGWGGYWTWDPVENAGLLPWFTATAFLHSVMVQERRGMLKVWNVALVITTFFLTIFATFMTRAGIVQSVHAFGESRELALLFTIFMIVIAGFSLALVIWRLPLLRSRNDLDSWVSREGAFLVNNWILLFSAFFVLFATMFPTLSEAVTGERLTVGPPFFNKWMLPVGLILLALTGVGPLLAWRKSTRANLIEQFVGPVAFAFFVAGALVAFGVRVWSSGICFALCALVIGTIAQEFWRGAEVRRATTGTDRLTAIIGLVSRSKRRYGGYIVHVGIAVMFLGFAGEGFKQEGEALLKPGQEITVGAFTVRHDALRVTSDSQKQMITGHVSVLEDGKPIAAMEPAKWFFAKRENEPPTTEVAIRRGFWEDVYVVLAGFNAAEQSATYAVTINPLVNWVWLGFAILAFGTILAMMPEAAFALAAARVPSGAATATMLLVLVLSPAVAAQGTVDKAALLRDLEGEILCVCGGCKRPMDDCPMEPNCHGLEPQREKLKAYVDRGMTREQVLAAFAADYGTQAVLARPIDKGFNRLAWFVPYAVGVLSALGAVVIARRWSRRDRRAEAESVDLAAPQDAELSRRLDHELRDLD